MRACPRVCLLRVLCTAASMVAPSPCALRYQLLSINPQHPSLPLQGVENFQNAVSQTTMQLMQRRLGYTAAQAGSGSSRNSDSGSRQPGSTHTLQRQHGAGSSGGGSGLELHQLLGSGSFASVYLGTWRGKQVAVKVGWLDWLRGAACVVWCVVCSCFGHVGGRTQRVALMLPNAKPSLLSGCLHSMPACLCQKRSCTFRPTR